MSINLVWGFQKCCYFWHSINSFRTIYTMQLYDMYTLPHMAESKRGKEKTCWVNKQHLVTKPKDRGDITKWKIQSYLRSRQLAKLCNWSTPHSVWLYHCPLSGIPICGGSSKSLCCATLSRIKTRQLKVIKLVLFHRVTASSISSWVVV